MAFILIAKNGEEIMINAWNWRPTLELLLHGKVIDEDLYDRMGRHGREAKIDAGTASTIADFIEERIKIMKPGERLRADLTITDRPKTPLVITPETKIEEIDSVDVYSATYDWLIQFRDFSRASEGFEVS